MFIYGRSSPSGCAPSPPLFRPSLIRDELRDICQDRLSDSEDSGIEGDVYRWKVMKLLSMCCRDVVEYIVIIYKIEVLKRLEIKIRRRKYRKFLERDSDKRF